MSTALSTKPGPADVRSWRISHLTPHGTVAVKRKGAGIEDTNETPAEWGLWGMTPHERAIVRRGLTSSGADRDPRRISHLTRGPE